MIQHNDSMGLVTLSNSQHSEHYESDVLPQKQHSHKSSKSNNQEHNYSKFIEAHQMLPMTIRCCLLKLMMGTISTNEATEEIQLEVLRIMTIYLKPLLIKITITSFIFIAHLQ